MPGFNIFGEMMLIEIEEKFTEIKMGSQVDKIRHPSMQESDKYANAHASSETQDEKNSHLERYLMSLGMSEKVYKALRYEHFEQLLESFKGKKS